MQQKFPYPEVFSIADAENMGAIIRTAAAFGAKAVIVDDQCCDPYLRRSVRVSMGTIVDVEILRVPELPQALQEFKELSSAKIIGAAITERSVPLHSVVREGNTIIVFGSEGWGMRKETMNACDVLSRIPIVEHVDSLNVTVACGIFLYALSHPGD